MSAIVALWLALHASAVSLRMRLWAAAMLLIAFLAVVVITPSVADESAASLEAICGQIFLVTLIARLVANFAGRRSTRQAARGQVEVA